jgi:hypothetical protein
MAMQLAFFVSWKVWKRYKMWKRLWDIHIK